jgi:hypothetical protein
MAIDENLIYKKAVQILKKGLHNGRDYKIAMKSLRRNGMSDMCKKFRCNH